MNNKKFKHDEIYDFFDYINDKVTAPMGWAKRIYMVERCNGLSDFKYPDYVKTLVTTPKFNARIILDAGYVYDRMSDKERIEYVKKTSEKFLKVLKNVLDSSEKYNNIEAIDVTKKLDIQVTRHDRSDDGNDHFGIGIYLKFRYKKSAK